MSVTYTSGTTLSFQEVMFTFEDMITGSQVSDIEPPSSTVYTIEKNGFVNKFIGTDLVYTVINGNTFITGGTIQETRLEDADGNLIGSLSNLNLPAQDVTDALIAEATGIDVFALENLFFNQNWIINGADGIDNIFSADQDSEDGQAFGFTGNDRAFLGDGDDFINLGSGSDRIFGGEGNDTLIGGADRDRLRGDEGNDALYGGTGDDNLKGGIGDDLLNGGADNDVLRGQRGNDTLQGDDGNDRIFGNGGRDVLYGNADDDNLNGGGGRDILNGGTGNDILTGGKGRDTFEFISGDGSDTITDFEIGTETLIINGIEAFTNGVIDNETLSDGTEITVNVTADGYEVIYGTDDIIFIGAELIV
ncbi:calcium-binding protein [Amylibacter sp. SFDW26]|uniref:calcium-binding protein n=1 Tax=Amylibacter sp. SFDW26 TaxID=2652722 RepID=UPI0012625FD5|nr:calcium-binding protein [Amylibacter sp. SFDW26]KAB7615518.1 calcium-binding protein [Amylibacter sp. SFDW26]